MVAMHRARWGEVEIAWMDARGASRIAGIASDAERRRAERHQRPEDRDRSLAGAVLLRLLASRFTGYGPSDVPIHRHCDQCGEEHGQPTLDDGWFASVAHAGQWACVALTMQGPVGIDMEPMGAKVDASVRSVILDDEDPGRAERWPDYLALWVRKEAVLKATGEGLTTDPSAIWIGDSNLPAAFVKHAKRPELRCRLVDVREIEEYQVACALLLPDAD